MNREQTAAEFEEMMAAHKAAVATEACMTPEQLAARDVHEPVHEAEAAARKRAERGFVNVWTVLVIGVLIIGVASCMDHSTNYEPGIYDSTVRP